MQWRPLPSKGYDGGRKAEPSWVDFVRDDGSPVVLSDALRKNVRLSVKGKLPNDIAAKIMVRIEVGSVSACR